MGKVAHFDADETKNKTKETILLWLEDDHYQALLPGAAGEEPSELDRWPEPVLLQTMVASAMKGEAGSLRGKGPTKKDKERATTAEAPAVTRAALARATQQPDTAAEESTPARSSTSSFDLGSLMNTV